MKLLIASDIHGDLESLELVLAAYKNEGADKLLLLGDLLYHGPRNDLPPTYAPKRVIELLNAHKNDIIAVRGNCDTEVDQMVLEFPILADYAYLSLDGISVFATHGHKYGASNPPPLKEGEILLHGHTHVTSCERLPSGNLYLNPGSAAIPKENTKRGYMIYSDKVFTAKSFDGEKIFEKVLF